ncbi:MAG: serine hydrolase [Candidatus Hydrogenedentes bacterium]|nr:serine hydrolase [Candidatus Hydrogenedentota bacterium]
MRKRLGKLAALFVLLLVVAAGVLWITVLSPIVHVGAAFQAKNYCSSLFISGRAFEDIQKRDLTDPRLAYFTVEVDTDAKSVTGSLFGIARHTAIFREGCGCTLLSETAEDTLRAQPVPQRMPKQRDEAAPWPEGNAPIPGVVDTVKDKARLQAALDVAFSEETAEPVRGTRAIVVVYDGRIVAERYLDGLSKDMPLSSYSMTKSIIGALVGIRVKEGKLNIHEPAPVPEWKDPADPRHAITLDQLLRMSSGLEFDESYRDFTSDAIRMLHLLPDSGAFAASKPLAHAPEEEWYYSSGTTNLISRAIRHSFDGDDQAYLNFPYQALLDPIGMNHSTLETDASGTYVGSSYMYATVRDWARFGLLCLNDGVWNGERILPEGWIAYVRTATPKSPAEDQYGAHFWLNLGTPGNPEDRRWKSLPTETFACMGFEGQQVFMIPSRKTVVVRMGQTRRSGAWNYEQFVGEVLASLPG